MALRAAVDGLGVEIPYTYSINDTNYYPFFKTGKAYHAPFDHRAVANGIPYYDGMLHTDEGEMSLREWFDKKNLPQADRDYISEQIDKAIKGAGAGKWDKVGVNVAPLWSPRCVICNPATKKLIISNRTLFLRTSHEYRASVQREPAMPMKVSATLSVNVKLYTSIHGNVYARNAYGNSWTRQDEVWTLGEDDILYKKGTTSFIFAVPGQRVGNGMELLCTFEQIQALVPELGHMLNSGINASGAETPNDLLKAQPFFAAHTETHAIIDALYPPDPLGSNLNYLPGVYTKSDGSSFLVFGMASPATTPNGNTNGFVDRIALDEHTGDPVTGVEVSTPPANVDANDYEPPDWSTSGTYPIAAQSSAVLPILFRCSCFCSYGNANTNGDDTGHVLEIVINTGNLETESYDMAYIRAQCQPFMWGAAGATYDYIPLDGAPEIEVEYDYGDGGNYRSMLFKVPLAGLFQTDSQGNYIGHQEATLRYSVSPTSIFHINPGALHAGFIDEDIVTGSTSGAVEYTHPTTTIIQTSRDNSKV